MSKIAAEKPTARSRLRRSTDPVAWLAVGALSAGAFHLRTVVPDEATRQPIYLVALLLIGGVVGVFWPDRCWRWGVAGLIGVVVADLNCLVGSAQPASLQPQAVWEHMLASAPHWVVVGMAILLGAYLGSKLPGAGL